MSKSYKKYIVATPDFEEAISFYKSDKSGRWWMEVPYPSNQSSRYSRHHLVPCNYSDYEKAMSDELPDLWWQTYQKLT